MADKFKLNSEQKAVVDCRDKHIVCIAGAGSGKTFTMIQRILRLVGEGVDPSSIIALTFTNAAGVEMKTRYRNLAEDISKLPDFRTFHSFCYNLLCTDFDVLQTLGYDSPPSIADDKLIKKIESELKHDTGIDIPSKKSKKAPTPKQEYNQKRYNQLLNKKLYAQNTITFDQLCRGVCELFIANHPCIEKYKEQLKYIFIDEFQDTDPIQWEFAKSFKDATIFVCGDICQGIYSFRKADSSIMKRLLKDDDWTTLKITHNYRSTKPIVDYANYVVSLVPNHIKMETDIEGEKINEIYINSRRHQYMNIDYTSRNHFIKWIENYKQNPYKGSVAIIAKTNKHVDDLKDILSENGVEYSENANSSEVPFIIKAVSDNEYMILWAASYLKNDEYIKFLRCESLGYTDCDEDDSHTVKFYKTFAYRFPQVKYRVDTVVEIRNTLSDDELNDVEKCGEVFRLLDMRCEIDQNADLSTPKKILDYAESVYETSSNSTMYVGTVHSVKGLEFDQVLLFSVNDYSFDLGKDDNTNLCYVGITRAKKDLTVFIHG